jgi:hypothetical protein
MRRVLCLLAALIAAIIAIMPTPSGMTLPMYALAYLSGSAVGMLRDPFTWIGLLLVLVVTVRYPVMGLLVAVTSSAIILMIGWSWQDQLGIPVYRRLMSGLRMAALLYLMAAPIPPVFSYFRNLDDGPSTSPTAK